MTAPKTPERGWSQDAIPGHIREVNKRSDETGEHIAHECVSCGRLFGHDAVLSGRVKLIEDGWECATCLASAAEGDESA